MASGGHLENFYPFIHLCLTGDLLTRLRGERDLRLIGEWFNLRLELKDGLSSLRPPASSRDRILLVGIKEV